jgi:hypothetical protein
VSNVSAIGLQRIWHALAQPYLWLVTRALLLLSARSKFAGFEVVNVAGGTTTVPLAHLASALTLIGLHAPLRLARIKRDIRRLLIIGAGAAEYWPRAEGIAIARASLAELGPEELALVLVHEATHARVQRAGIPYLPALRERIERLCVAQEVAFAERLSEPQEWVKFAERKLASPWWTEDRVKARRATAKRKLRGERS